jgi:hypothetical protein
LGAQSVSAQTCIEDRYFQATGGHLTRTANDVRIARASNIRDTSGNPLESCVSGQTFSFIADFTVQTTATARYDIGLYFATDGDPNHDGALAGQCSTNIITQSLCQPREWLWDLPISFNLIPHQTHAATSQRPLTLRSSP